jgi:competence protein ComEC
VLLLAVSPLAWLASFIGLLLQYIIALLNGIVVLVEALPWSVISGVNITAVQCVVMMGMIILVVRFFESRKFQFVYGVLLLLMVFAGMEWRNLLAEKDHDQLIVYRVQGHGALEWIKGSQSYFYPDSALAADKRKLRFHIQPNRVLSGVGDTPTYASGPAFQRSFSGFRFFLLGKTTVLWIDDDRNDLPINGVADYLIVGNDAVRSLERLSDRIKFKKLILDSSNSTIYATRMAGEAAARNISVHSVLKEGAFVVNL